MSSFRDLLFHRKRFAWAMKIFEISKTFPKEEIYSLAEQIRRCCPRSVCTNIAEGYGKRRYRKHFIEKLTDSDGEIQQSKCG